MWKGLGYVARSTTTHPGFKKARLRSPDWRLVRAPSLALGREKGRFKRLRHADTRLTTGWEYVGEALPRIAWRGRCSRSDPCTMSRTRLTPEIQKSIVAFVRAGGYPDVAAEAAGIPRELFRRWMKQADGPRPSAAVRELAQAVRQAQAQARLGRRDRDPGRQAARLAQERPRQGCP